MYRDDGGERHVERYEPRSGSRPSRHDDGRIQLQIRNRPMPQTRLYQTQGRAQKGKRKKEKGKRKKKKSNHEQSQNTPAKRQ